MRNLQVVMSVISTLLAAFTLICALWLAMAADMAGSVHFLVILAIATGVSVLITTIITLIRK